MFMFELSRMMFILLVCLLSNSDSWVWYPCWDGFKRRCGKHTDHFITCCLGHRHGVGKCRLHLKGKELNLSSTPWMNAGIYEEERYDCLYRLWGSFQESYKSARHWSHLKDSGKGIYCLAHLHILKVLAGKILCLAINWTPMDMYRS